MEPYAERSSHTSAVAALSNPTAAPGGISIWSGAQLRDMEALRIGTSEVLYAFVSLAGEPSSQDEALLDDEERARSRRFVHRVDCYRFVIAHAALRLILARCIDVDSAAIRYEHGDHGKPRLAPGLGRLEFNLSHSQDLALLAITRDRPVGVDVEWLRVLSGDVMDLSETQFSETERKVLRALPPAERRTGFFRCWTRKEALIKASGEGLTRDLDSFDVDVSPGSKSALLQIDGRIGQDAGWLLRDLPAPPGYAAAGALEGGSYFPRSLGRRSPPIGHPCWRNVRPFELKTFKAIPK
ncbi:MAG: phosphopantetheine-protein transferase [Frankiales bacterium]|nr:phosphopantetheine-protein transferase [Frankiales bacterium]